MAISLSRLAQASEMTVVFPDNEMELRAQAQESRRARRVQANRHRTGYRRHEPLKLAHDGGSQCGEDQLGDAR